MVQSIVNDNEITREKKSKLLSDIKPQVKYFKVYHLYVIAGLIILVFGFGLINKLSKEGKFKQKTEIIDNSQINTESEPTVEKQQTVNGNALTAKEQTPEEKETQKEVKDVSTEKTGSHTLKIKVREVAWVQIIGIDQDKVLFEGDVFPNIEPSEFTFSDKAGFVLATGNAGAFEIGADQNSPIVLGKSGQLIKWYYPQDAQDGYKKIQANQFERREGDRETGTQEKNGSIL